MPILVCIQKNSSDFRTIRETKCNLSSHMDVFLKGPLFSKSTLNLARFDTKFVAALWQGSLKSSVKIPLCILCFHSCAFSVTEAPADHKSTNEEDVRLCSHGNKPVFTEEINKAQVFKTVEFLIDFIRRS